MMKYIKTIVWAGVWLFLLGRAGDCGDLTPVVYRLKWLFNTSVVGDLYADVHGAFDRRGIKVTIKEGGPERDAIKELELGYAQFGVASARPGHSGRGKGISDCRDCSALSGESAAMGVSN